MRTLPVEKIAERLADRFRLLTRGDRTAMPRQQTLRASIDWSFDLLPEPERALLRRLAVFAGGWTLEAAEAVASGNGIDESSVLDLLSRLVEKSLVELEAEGERYRLLESVRDYALEKLRASGEEDATRTRHLEFYLALAGKARPELAGPAQGAWLARLDSERENLLSAHDWCNRIENGAELGLTARPPRQALLVHSRAPRPGIPGDHRSARAPWRAEAIPRALPRTARRRVSSPAGWAAMPKHSCISRKASPLRASSATKA